MTICDPQGRECYDNIVKTADSHCKLPVPCQGYYAEFRASHIIENSIITNQNPEFQRILFDYESYKGRMTGKYDGYSTVEDMAKKMNITGKQKLR